MGFLDAICPVCENRSFNPWSGTCKSCGYNHEDGTAGYSKNSSKSKGTETESEQRRTKQKPKHWTEDR